MAACRRACPEEVLAPPPTAPLQGQLPHPTHSNPRVRRRRLVEFPFASSGTMFGRRLATLPLLLLLLAAAVCAQPPPMLPPLLLAEDASTSPSSGGFRQAWQVCQAGRQASTLTG